LNGKAAVLYAVCQYGIYASRMLKKTLGRMMKNGQKKQENEYGRQKVRLQDLIQLHQQNK